MIFELRPFHVARLMMALCAIPILWAFSVEGVTTTTEYDLVTGETTTSNDMGSQFDSVGMWIVFAIAFGVTAWVLEKRRMEWPGAVKEQLRSVRLAPPLNSDGTQP